MSTSITTSAADDTPGAPSATTATCENGDIGTLVVVPSGSRRGHVRLEIVTAVGVPEAACAPPAFGPSCIVARRSLGFVPHVGLTLPVAMRGACRGVVCGANDTCVNGSCRSAAIDPSACESAAGCSEGALGPPGTPPPTDDAGALDASSDGSTLDGGPPDAASAVPELLFSTAREVDVIALGDTNVYFVEAATDFGIADGTVSRVAKGGGARAVLADSLDSPVSLAVNSTHAFWFDNTGLESVPKVGGTVTLVQVVGGIGVTPLSVQADDTYLYWGTNPPLAAGAALRARTDGQMLFTVGPTTGGVPSVAIDQGSVAFATRDNAANTGAIRLRAPSDSIASVVANTSALQVAALALVALSGNKLAWTDGANGGSVMGRNGAQPVTIATAQGAVFALAIDANGIYWFHTTGGATKLERASWTGETATLLTGLSRTQALAMDASYLYYWQGVAPAGVYRLHR